MDQNWRMEKLKEDIATGLKPTEYFSPLRMGQTAEGLGRMGYKNTTLIPKFFDKLKIMVENEGRQVPEDPNISLEDS